MSINTSASIDAGKRNLLAIELCILLVCSLSMSNIAVAEEAVQWNETTLSGDWGGKRSHLSERGVNIEFTHRSDVILNMSGGIKRGTAWLGYTNVSASADLGKLHGWQGLSAYIDFHSGLGDKPNETLIGSAMGVDNIEVANNTAQFYNVWMQKNWMDDSLSVLAGLYSVDSEFYVTDTSGLFLHPSMGMAAELAQAGVNGPPVYPMGALGTRIKYTFLDHKAYLQVALTDGVPGDPNNPNGTQIKLDAADGTFAIAEVGYSTAEKNKTAFGMWRYSTQFDDLVDKDVNGNWVKRDSVGWYALAERTLYTEEKDAGQGLAGFIRYGMASADIYQSDWSASMGLQYTGLFAGRDEDVAGVAVTNSHASSKSPLAVDESMIEVTYRIQPRPWLGVQPLLQRIIHPGMDSSVTDASLLGVRIEISI